MNVSMRIEIVKLYYSLGESATAALRGCKTKHGLIKDPFSVPTITRLIANFESTGSVLDFSGKERKSLSDERAPIVHNAVEQLQSQSTMASSSITQVSQLTGILRASVHRIMRRHFHLYPYHITFTRSQSKCATMARFFEGEKIPMVSQLTGIPRASVHLIMRRHFHLYPYHITFTRSQSKCATMARFFEGEKIPMVTHHKAA
ncbi:hypothetical protein CLF_105319 [Clonorchis sinensis]|uniref:DUF4817 domain-containing protein n=1 Tax=Clonorchis sinensis TaxID=79923 RepID=G7YDD4_CLOSI|nr:hypothetical protein CLF_105319 [Clonorchis sinensis]